MADKTHIEWTDATWNPITGCKVVSPGCTNCYAMKLAGTRLQHHPSRKGLTVDTKAGPVWTGEVRFNEQWLADPLRWKKPRQIFVCAHADLFGENVPFEWVDRVFGVMALASWHTYQILTKRPDRMREYMRGRRRKLAQHMVDEYLSKPDGTVGRAGRAVHAAWPVKSVGDLAQPDAVAMATWPLPNVWLGVSAEDQQRWDERVPELMWTPAAKRFVSIEPMLGPIKTDVIEVLGGDAELYPLAWTTDCIDQNDDPVADIPPLDLIILGGENGPRPMHPDWARQVRDACAAEGVPFFFKQWGSWKEAFHDQDGPKVDVVDADDDAADSVMAIFACRETAFVSADGQTFRGHHHNLPEGAAWRLVVKAPKGENGRLLDGVEHNGMPEAAYA